MTAREWFDCQEEGDLLDLMAALADATTHVELGYTVLRLVNSFYESVEI